MPNAEVITELCFVAQAVVSLLRYEDAIEMLQSYIDSGSDEAPIALEIMLAALETSPDLATATAWLLSSADPDAAAAGATLRWAADKKGR